MKPGDVNLAAVSTFRGFLDVLEKYDQLVRIDHEVDWDLELGAMMRYCNEKRAPAQLYGNVKDCLPGASVTGGLYTTNERVAIAFGLSPDTDYHDLVEFYAEAMTKRLASVIVDSGPCQEVVNIGDDIDLLQYPVPRAHDTDGGPYGRFMFTVNTGVCKDPDSDWVNWGTYRGQIQAPNAVGVYLQPQNHGGRIWAKYNERKQVMEYASFQGSDPLCFILSSSGIPYGHSEVEVIGGVRGRPVELVKCKTVDLYVPADAEFVVEGTITPGDLMEEGPFGEYPGYTVAGIEKRPVVRVSAVTHRKDPILTSICIGIPPAEGINWALQLAGVLKKTLQDKGIPILKVAVPEESGFHSVVVSTKKPHGGVPQMIAFTIWTDQVGKYFPYVVVVDEDVDPANLSEVYHAICTKCEPANKIHVYKDTAASPLTPYVRRGKHKDEGFGGSNVLLDCTWPFDWEAHEIPIREAFETSYTEEMKQRAKAILKNYGIN